MEDLDEGRDSGRNVLGMRTLPQMSLLQLLSALCEQMFETNSGLCALSPWGEAERESNANQMFVILFDASPEKCSDDVAMEQSLGTGTEHDGECQNCLPAYRRCRFQVQNVL